MFVRYDAVRPHLKTFDLLLSRGSGPVAATVAALTRATVADAPHWTHCGLVVRAESFPAGSPLRVAGAVYVFESCSSLLPGAPRPAAGAHAGRGFLGVQLRRLDEVVRANVEAGHPMALAQLSAPDAGAYRRALEAWPEIFARYDGTPYELVLCNLFGVALRCCRPCRPHTGRIVCSELVARVLRDAGLLRDPAGRPLDPEDVLPVDFLRRPGAAATYDADRQISPIYENAAVLVHDGGTSRHILYLS